MRKFSKSTYSCCQDCLQQLKVNLLYYTRINQIMKKLFIQRHGSRGKPGLRYLFRTVYCSRFICSALLVYLSTCLDIDSPLPKQIQPGTENIQPTCHRIQHKTMTILFISHKVSGTKPWTIPVRFAVWFSRSWLMLTFSHCAEAIHTVLIKWSFLSGVPIYKFPYWQSKNKSPGIGLIA